LNSQRVILGCSLAAIGAFCLAYSSARAAPEVTQFVLPILPHQATFIFSIEVQEAAASRPAIEPVSPNPGRRVVFRIDHVIKGGRPGWSAGTIASSDLPARLSPAQMRLAGADFWSDKEVRAHDRLLVFAQGDDKTMPAQAFTSPLSIERLDPNHRDPIDDIRFIYSIENTSADQQAARVAALLRGDHHPTHTEFLGQYIGWLAPNVSALQADVLLQIIAQPESWPLDDAGGRELLRCFHLSLLMKERPQQEEVRTLATASIRILARVRPTPTGTLPDIVEQAAKLYLPWATTTLYQDRTPTRRGLGISDTECPPVADSLEKLTHDTRLDDRSRRLLTDWVHALRDKAGK